MWNDNSVELLACGNELLVFLSGLLVYLVVEGLVCIGCSQLIIEPAIVVRSDRTTQD